MDTSIEKFSGKGQQLIKLLCSTARLGLAECYTGQNFYIKKIDPENSQPNLSMAWNLRYIIISQIGIKKWMNSSEAKNENLPDLWDYIHSQVAEIKSAGDLGLAIWAAVETGSEDSWIFLERLTKKWPNLRAFCNAVEFAWVVQGLVRFSENEKLPDKALTVLEDAKNQLLILHNSSNGLFGRHNRNNFKEILSRSVACFADQVYPILALANYGAVFGDENSINASAAAADAICRLQGPQGQWWWHYDIQNGTVAEEYPVFTIHQDSMAPMALFAIDAAAGTDHSMNIEKGLLWYDSNSSMIMPERGLIWRDIHRREIPKMYRIARSVLVAGKFRNLNQLAGKNLFGYTINKECRPYHLGWILYAWSDQI